MNALGLVEVIGYVAAIEASDACLKSANVNIVGIDKVGSGIVTVTISGDVGAVKSAVEAAELAASKVGTLRGTHVIPRLHQDVAEILFKKENEKQTEEVFIEKETAEITTIDDVQIKENTFVEENNTELEFSVENIDETKENEDNTNEDKNNLSKMSVKELKALAKKLDPSITNKKLNLLKKEELIAMVEKFDGEDR